MVGGAFFFRLLICLLSSSVFLFSYLEKQNQLTRLQIQIPHIQEELKLLKEENTRLTFYIHQFESPRNLMQLLVAHPEFNLCFQEKKHIVVIPTPAPLLVAKQKEHSRPRLITSSLESLD